MATCEMESSVHGYYVIKTYGMQWFRRYFDDEDRYVVAVLKDDTVVFHISRKIFWICSLSLARVGAITCVTIGGRRYSSQLQLNIFAIIFGTKYFRM